MSQLVWFGRAGRRFVASHVGRHKHWTHNLQKFLDYWNLLANTQTHTHTHILVHRKPQASKSSCPRATGDETHHKGCMWRCVAVVVFLTVVVVVFIVKSTHAYGHVCVSVCLCWPSVLLVFVSQVFNKKLLNNLCSLFVLPAAGSVRERGRAWRS